MKNRKTLVIILAAVLLLGGLASISAKTTLSNYIMSLIKGGQGECGGRTCEGETKCETECGGSGREGTACTGADDCGGKPCKPVDCPTTGMYCEETYGGAGGCNPSACKGGTKCNNEDNPCPSGGYCQCAWNCNGTIAACGC